MKRFIAILFAASLMPLCVFGQSKGGASSAFGGSGGGGGGGSGTVTSVATGTGLQGGTITTTGTIDLKILTGGGLSKALGGGTDELGVAALGITSAMLAGSITDDKLGTISTAGKVSNSALDATVTLGGNTFSGTGAFAKIVSPIFTTPAIGDATGASFTVSSGGSYRTGTSNGNTALLQAYDVDGTAYTTFLTLNAANSPSLTVNESLTWTSGKKQTFAPSSTTSGFNVGSVAGDVSTPANGDLWYDSTGNLLRARINGSTISVGGGGSGTPGGADTQFQYNNAGAFAGLSSFTVSGTTITQTGRFNLSPTTGATVGMVVNQASSPTADPMSFQWSGTTWASFTQRRTLNFLAINPASTSDGDIWSSSDQRSIFWNKSGNTFATNLTYWVSAATVLVSGTTKTSLSGTSGIPSNANKTIPANFFVIGKAACFEADGYLNTSASPSNLTITLENAAGVLATTGVQTPTASLTNRGFLIRACFTVRGSTSVFAQGSVTFRDSASNMQIWDMVNTTTSTFDTTITETPDLFATYATSVGGNNLNITATRYYVLN